MVSVNVILKSIMVSGACCCYCYFLFEDIFYFFSSLNFSISGVCFACSLRSGVWIFDLSWWKKYQKNIRGLLYFFGIHKFFLLSWYKRNKKSSLNIFTPKIIGRISLSQPQSLVLRTRLGGHSLRPKLKFLPWFFSVKI